MKKTLILVLLTFFSQLLSSQGHWDHYIVEKKENTDYMVYAENVNVRDKADLNGNILFTLQPGNRIKIIAKQEALSEINQMKEYWYKIDSKGKKGFVWGGLISDAAYPLGNRQIVLKNLGVKKNTMEIKLLEKEKIIAKLNWDSGPANGERDYKIKIYDPHKFKPAPEQLFSLEYFVYSEIEYGAVSIQLFSLSKELKLKNEFSWTPGACDPPVCGETTVLFPGDSLKADKKLKRTAYKAKENTILLVDHNFDTDNSEIHEYFTHEYQWNGKSFNKKEN